MSDDEKLLALLKKLPTELAIPVLKLSLKIDRLVEERDQLRAAIEADREGREGWTHEWVTKEYVGGDWAYVPSVPRSDEAFKILTPTFLSDATHISHPTASPEPDKETP